MSTTTGFIATDYRRLASGNYAIVDLDTGQAIGFITPDEILDQMEDAWFDEGPTCSICDALGHGYPGGGPCPLEERGEDGVPEWAQ